MPLYVLTLGYTEPPWAWASPGFVGESTMVAIAACYVYRKQAEGTERYPLLGTPLVWETGEEGGHQEVVSSAVPGLHR